MKQILLIVFSVSVSLCLVSCDKGTSGVRSKDVARFANRSNLVIPPSAKATDVRSPFSRDGVMMLRLEIPTQDLAVFLSKSGLDGELNNNNRPESATRYLVDFLPAHPKRFREGQKSLSKGEFLNVLIDEDSATNAVVYLYWFGT